MTTQTEARQAAEEKAAFSLIEGDVTLTNEVDGGHKTFRFTPFYVRKATPWVDIVDEAVEQVTPEEGSWLHMGEDGLNERACPRCVDRILTGFGPRHDCGRPGHYIHCTAGSCF